MNTEFDLAFSLGQACACSQSLRLARLQFASFPFDWVAGGTLQRRVAILLDRFEHWFDEADFAYDGTNPINGLGLFHNLRTGIHHPHDFEDAPIERSYAKAADKYNRRTTRLLALLGNARRVLCTYVDKTAPGGPASPSHDELRKAQADLAAAFPNAEFDLVHFALDRDVPFERRVVSSPSPGVTEIRFDYHDDEKDVNCTTVAKALLSLGIKVRDYRTKEERRAHSLKRQMKKYGVDSRFALFMAKTKELLLRILGTTPKTRTRP